MKRGTTGNYVVSSDHGEEVRAFVPFPLPPKPEIVLSGNLLATLESANLALGRLDGVSEQLSDKWLFLYFYVRREAVLSSQIEGTQSSLSDLLRYERDEAPGVPEGDAAEVSRCVSALNHGLKRLKEDDFPLSNRLIREVHAILLAEGRGSAKTPGEFRRSQVWIGGSRPGNAVFVPAPHFHVQECMADLERFLHSNRDELPMLVRIGLAHVQLETIHPFLDGNGRVGRLLITFLLCHYGILRDPLLYLSLYLKQNRSQYYDLLNEVRLTGDWEAWLAFFLEGVREVAENAVSTARRVWAMKERDRESVRQLGRRTASALRVFEALTLHPLQSIASLGKETGLSQPGVVAGVNALEELGIVSEATGKTYGRVYTYQKYLALFSEGT